MEAVFYQDIFYEYRNSQDPFGETFQFRKPNIEHMFYRDNRLKDVEEDTFRKNILRG